MTACIGRYVSATSRLTIVRELLAAGADATLINKSGETALHGAATRGDDMDVIDLLTKTAPTTLNHVDNQGASPLCIAAYYGWVNTVRHLLAAGATQSRADGHIKCPLFVAVQQGHEGVARILLTDAGMEAIGAGPGGIYLAMQAAVLHERAHILHIICAPRLDREPLQGVGIRIMSTLCTKLLHLATERFSCPATISVLLAAGAETEGLHLTGRPTGNVIGRKGAVTQETQAACCRMLQRAPAFHARPWAWSSGRAPAASGLVSGAREPRPSLGVRIFRPLARVVVVRFIDRCDSSEKLATNEGHV